MSEPHAPEPLDTSAFEHLHGERPWQVLDRHPDNRHVALRVIAVLATTVHRAAVWDLETRHIAWAPDGVSALAWLPGGGNQVALVYEEYARAPDHPTLIGSPLQSEFAYAFVLASWPSHEVQARCPLEFPTGWPVDLVLSPRGDLAVVQWLDQEESGLEFVALDGEGPRQFAETGFPQLGPLRGFSNGGGFPLNTALVFRPVFSPDGRYLLVPWQEEMVWWSEDAYDFDTTGNYVAPPSPGGEYTLGTISILDWHERTHHAIPLVERVAAGWRPEPREDGGDGLLVEPPRFLDAEQFTIVLPTSTVQTFSVTTASS